MKGFFFNKWWVQGLTFFVVCYISAEIIIPLIKKDSITQKDLLIGIIAWAIAGLLWGLVTKILAEIKNKKTQPNN